MNTIPEVADMAATFLPVPPQVMAALLRQKLPPVVAVMTRRGQAAQAAAPAGLKQLAEVQPP